jgi:inner membrane protein YidH
VAENANSNRARDHLANERTFLAWVRTGAAIVVFGFAIGRFSIAMRQLTALQGHPVRTAGISVWMGAFTIVAGVMLVVAGLARYRKTRAQLDAGTFEPAGFVVDLITALTVVFGLVLAGYLIYTEKLLG